MVPTGQLIVAHPDLPTAMDGEAATLAGDVGIEANMNVYDFPFNYATRPVGDGNFIADPLGGWQPRMYESWSVSDDGLKWTFKVRKNVVSPYGNELTADDFKWHMEKAVAQGAIWNFVIGSTGLKSHEQIDVVDSHTVEFNLPVPNIVFFFTQTIYWHVFDSTEMKKHQTEDDPWSVNWLENNSAGFGTYQLSSVREGEQWEFEPNPNYWDTPANHARVIILGIPDASIRTSLLEAGTIDIAWELSPDDFARLEGKPGVKILQDPDGLFGMEIFLVMNNGKAPFDDVNLRKAIQYATPYDEIIQGVFLGKAARQHSTFRVIDWGIDPDKTYYDFDPDKARAALAESAYADGTSASVVLRVESATAKLVAAVLKSTLKDILNIDLSIEILASAEYQEARYTQPRPYQMSLEDTGRLLVPHSLYSITHSYQPAGISCCNLADYVNEGIPPLLATAVASLDDAEQIQLIREIQTMIMEDAPKVPVAYLFDRLAVRDNISGHTFAAWPWINWGRIVKG